MHSAQVGEESPRQDTTTTQHSRKNLKMTQGWGGKDALTQVLPLTQLLMVEGVLEERGLRRCVWHLRELPSRWKSYGSTWDKPQRRKMSRCFVAPWTLGEGRKFESRHRVNVSRDDTNDFNNERRLDVGDLDVAFGIIFFPISAHLDQVE